MANHQVLSRIDASIDGAPVVFNQQGQVVDNQYNVVGDLTIQVPVTSRWSPAELENRQRMLQRTKAEVDEWLEGSLRDVGLLPIPLEDQPEAVGRNQAHPPPPSTRAVAGVFDAADGELLILGAPGSGKSTLLYELASALITRADSNEGFPMPVVFRLASWAVQQRPLADWLVVELIRRDIPQAFARSWIDNDRILPLLDGLDEVVVEYRAACVAAIHAFRETRKVALPRIAVCCREAEYQELPQLRLRGAVLIHPLQPVQVDEYLAVGGEQLGGLRAALIADAGLREMATVPLWLNLMLLTYRGVPAASLVGAISARVRQTQLLEAYVETMFARRGDDRRYPRERVVHWLSWLASSLAVQSETVFYLDRLQPDWLPSPGARRRYALLDRISGGVVFGLAYGVPLGLIFGVVNWLMAAPVDWWFGGLLGIGFGAALGSALGMCGGRETSHERPRGIRQLGRDLGAAVRGFFLVWILGLAFGEVFTLTFNLGVGMPVGLYIGIFFSMPVGMVAALSGGPSVRPRWITPVETVRWSFARAARSALIGLCVGPPLGLALGLASTHPASGMVAKTSAYTTGGDPLKIGLFFALMLGLFFAVAAGLIGGLISGQIERRARPNDGIRRSVRRALAVGTLSLAVVGMPAGITFGLTAAVILAPPLPLLFGLLFVVGVGLPAALAFGLAFGGYACLSHLTLRLVLRQAGAMPLHYERFLDYATERIFLRRVGGGYIFVHRLVQEHFAAMESAKKEHDPRRASVASR